MWATNGCLGKSYSWWVFRMVNVSPVQSRALWRASPWCLIGHILGNWGKSGQIFSGQKMCHKRFAGSYAWSLTEQPAPGFDLMIKNMPPIWLHPVLIQGKTTGHRRCVARSVRDIPIGFWPQKNLSQRRGNRCHVTFYFMVWHGVTQDLSNVFLDLWSFPSHEAPLVRKTQRSISTTVLYYGHELTCQPTQR